MRELALKTLSANIGLEDVADLRIPTTGGLLLVHVFHITHRQMFLTFRCDGQTSTREWHVLRFSNSSAFYIPI